MPSRSAPSAKILTFGRRASTSCALPVCAGRPQRAVRGLEHVGGAGVGLSAAATVSCRGPRRGRVRHPAARPASTSTSESPISQLERDRSSMPSSAAASSISPGAGLRHTHAPPSRGRCRRVVEAVARRSIGRRRAQLPLDLGVHVARAARVACPSRPRAGSRRPRSGAAGARSERTASARPRQPDVGYAVRRLGQATRRVDTSSLRTPSRSRKTARSLMARAPASPRRSSQVRPPRERRVRHEQVPDDRLERLDVRRQPLGGAPVVTSTRVGEAVSPSSGRRRRRSRRRPGARSMARPGSCSRRARASRRRPRTRGARPSPRGGDLEPGDTRRPSPRR